MTFLCIKWSEFGILLPWQWGPILMKSLNGLEEVAICYEQGAKLFKVLFSQGYWYTTIPRNPTLPPPNQPSCPKQLHQGRIDESYELYLLTCASSSVYFFLLSIYCAIVAYVLEFGHFFPACLSIVLNNLVELWASSIFFIWLSSQYMPILGIDRGSILL